MKTYGIEKYGILNPKKVDRNNSPAVLTEEALATEPCKLMNTGALLVETGAYTGRSPKDRFIVDEKGVSEQIGWGTENKKFPLDKFELIYKKVGEYLSGKNVYLFDGFAGADPKYRVAVRVINEYASENLFMNNMLIRPTEKELASFKEDYTLIAVPGLKLDPKECGTNSEAAILLCLKRKLILVVGSKYAGEMKKSVFSLMNYLLPQKGVLGMHCSANMALDGSGDTALFFGLSGTGKTTLSADPKRGLIGDDEHGWSDDGIFNIEGGCYAKCIDLTEEREPEIFRAIKFGSLVENVIHDEATRVPDYSDGTLTENTRVGYPVDYIPNAAIPGIGGTPKTVIFLTADAYGVMPPISKLNEKQAQYYFVSGFTSKLAGTERGITSPVPTFSTCFGAPFMPLDPSIYAKMLAEKVAKSGANVYLVNTGWCGNSGKRMNLKYTRAMVTAALNGELEKAEFVTDPYFGVQVPTSCPGVPDEQMIPAKQWGDDQSGYDTKAKELAKAFVENFKQYTHMSDDVVAAGPQA